MPEGIWDERPICQLRHTSRVNGSSPIIARVFYESRGIAYQANANTYESLHTGFYKQVSPFEMFDSPTAESDYWMDPDQDNVHLNYSPVYGWIAYSHDFGNPFRTLAFFFAARNGGRVSFMKGRLGWLRSDPKSNESLKDVERVENWLVVLRVVIIHCEDRAAAQTGLFGLGGDVRVQVVPVSEQERMSALFDLAERLEGQDQVTHP